MTKIILTAENFAFGPISKLLFVAEKLKERKYTLIFAGYGTSLQLAKKFPFDEIYEIDTDNKEHEAELRDIISKGDLLISSMDIASIVIAKELSIPTVWIDCLFWFWKAIPEVVLDVDAYVREFTIDDSKNETQYEGKIKNFHTVGPIVGEMKQKQHRANRALISFGGGEASYWYKVGKDTNYPFVMTEILSRYVDWSSFEKVTISTNEKIIEELKKRYPNSLFEFKNFSQRDFIEELSSVGVLLTTAGLVTAESAFQQQTPTIFLPSSNNSHHLLLTELRKLSLAPASVQLDDYMEPIKIKDVDPHKSMQLVMQQLRKFEESTSLRENVGNELNRLVQTIDEWSPQYLRKANDYLKSLGVNGTQGVIDIIEKLLEKK
jgi:hypothetical protein